MENLKTEKKKDELLDDDIPALDDRRESVPLTQDNAVFTKSAGGLISLDLTGSTSFSSALPFSAPSR